jgi:hypothetical protein
VHTRAEIGRRTGLSRTAVAARARQLVGLGFVVEEAAAATTGGRPAGKLRVNRAGGVVLAASIGASKTKLGVCDLGGGVLAETGQDLSTILGPDMVLRTVADGLSRLRDKVDRPVRGISLCLPGPVDAAAGPVVESPLLPGWGGVPIALGFPGVPVLVDNDVNALTLAERTARPGVSDLLHVKVSTGIGRKPAGGGARGRSGRGVRAAVGGRARAGLPTRHRAGDAGSRHRAERARAGRRDRRVRGDGAGRGAVTAGGRRRAGRTLTTPQDDQRICRPVDR